MCAMEWRRLRSVLLRPNHIEDKIDAPERAVRWTRSHCSGASFSAALARITTTKPPSGTSRESENKLPMPRGRRHNSAWPT